MRYVIDITQKQAEEIESFIKKGKYNSFVQFITTAVENQIYIENSEIGEEKLESKNKRINNVSQPDVIIKDENKITTIRNKKPTKACFNTDLPTALLLFTKI